MRDLNKYTIDKLCTVLFSYLTRYRMVPALYMLARERQPDVKHTPAWQRSMEVALGGLKAELSRMLDYIQLSDDDILEIVYEHKNLIRYTFHDMYYYYQLIRSDLPEKERRVFEEERMKYYLPAMAEIVNSPFIDWRMGAFDTGVEHPTILDVGSGTFPFLKLFRRDNHGNIWYIGVDKRGTEKLNFDSLDKVIPHQYTMEIDTFLASKADHIVQWKEHIDTVFFGNSLHCMQEPTKLLEKVAKLPKVTKIMVVEFAPKSALNFMFNFHMHIHASTGAIISVPVDLNKWKVDVSHPTTQHLMWTYTKRKK